MMADDPAPITTEQPDPGAASGVQTDLFALAAGRQPAAAEQKKTETSQKTSAEMPAPVNTNVQADTIRKPLVFSEQDPYPHREGEKSPAEPKNAHNVRPRRPPVHLDRKAFDADCTFGDLLKAAREKAGYEIGQVASLTKLRAYYLIALEEANLDKLPPAVYVSAYIRTLCSLYVLDSESIAFIHEKHGSIPLKKDIPLSLIDDLESSGQNNEEETKRIKRLSLIGAAALVLLTVCIVWGIAAAVYFSHSPAADNGSTPENSSRTGTSAETRSGVPEFTDAEFDRLTAPQQMTSSSLKMSKKPALAE